MVGIVKTTLRNTLTGEKKVIQSKNLITDGMLNFAQLYHFALSSLHPIYSRGLGDLLLFRRPLAESRGNITLPANNPVIGSGMHHENYQTDYNSKAVGTFIEDEIVNENKIVTKWIFPAGIATGTISALGRTQDDGARFQYQAFTALPPLSAIQSTESIIPNANLGKIVYYDSVNKYIYGMYTANYTATDQVVYEIRRTFLSLPPLKKLTESYTLLSSSYTYETVATFTINNPGEYLTNVPYYDSNDKCIYMDLGPVSTGYMRYIKINPSNWTMQDLTIAIPDVNSVVVAGDRASTYQCRGEHGVYSHGYLYYAAPANINNVYDIYQVNLSTGAYTSFNTYGLRFNNSPIPVLARGVTEEVLVRGHSWRDGMGFLIVNHDMNNLVEVPSIGGDIITDRGNMGPLNDEKLMFSWNNSRNVYCPRTYIGTIYNYSTPIQKTAIDELTIEYTLTTED